MKRTKQRIRKLIRRNAVPAMVAAGFALIGVLTYSTGNASTFAISSEPELATVSGNAVVLSQQSGASGNGTVKFGSNTNQTTEALYTCYPHAFCDTSGNPVLLNGFNIRNIGIFNSQAALSEMQQIKNSGFNAVRLAMRWSVFEPTEGTYAADALTKLDTAVSNAKAAGLYIILDPIHLSGGGAETPAWASGADSVAKVQNDASPYLRFITQRFATEDAVVAIDLVNEPWQSSADHARLISMYNTLINAVRTVDSDKILLFEPQYGSNLLPAASIAALTNKTNLVYSPHSYYGGTRNASGSKICGSDANNDGFHDSTGNTCGNEVYDGTTGYYTPNLSEIDAHIKAWVDTAGASSIPVHIGEYGIGQSVANAASWRDHMVTTLNKYNLSRTWWEYYALDGFSATDDASGTPGAMRSWVTDLN